MQNLNGDMQNSNSNHHYSPRKMHKIAQEAINHGFKENLDTFSGFYLINSSISSIIILKI